jgi:exonuclease SbcD
MSHSDKIFKIAHISDLHLGKILRSQDLAQDQAAILAQIVEKIRALKLDLVVIAGDVFDRSIPSESAQTMFGWFMVELKRALPQNGRILVIPGNHDSPKRIAFAAELFESVGIHLVSEILLSPTLVLEKGGKRAAVWALPFVTHGTYSEFKRRLAEERQVEAGCTETISETISSMAGRMESIIANLRPSIANQHPSESNLRPSEYDLNILVAHCYVRGAVLSESDIAFIGGTEAVPVSLFEAFDYVALGHLHKMQALSPKVWYSGAPMPMSFGDEGIEKGFLYVELEDGEPARIERVELKPLHVFKRVRASFAELMADSAFIDDDYVEVLLTDEEPVYDAFNRLALRFPNLMYVRQEAFEKRMGTEVEKVGDIATLMPPNRETSSLDDTGNLAGKSLHTTVLNDFISFTQRILDEPPSQELLKAFEVLLRNAEEELS